MREKKPYLVELGNGKSGSCFRRSFVTLRATELFGSNKSTLQKTSKAFQEEMFFLVSIQNKKKVQFFQKDSHHVSDRVLARPDLFLLRLLDCLALFQGICHNL